MDDSWQVWQIFREWAQCVHQHYADSASALEEFHSTVSQGRHAFVKGQDLWHPDLESDDARTAKAAFGHWYNELLETNEEVHKEVRQDLKELKNRVWYMRSIFGNGSDPELRIFHFHA